MSRSVSAAAPATTANLGPLFDVIAVALPLRCRVSAELSKEWSVNHVGADRPEAHEDDGVVKAAQNAVGNRPLALTVDSEIPIGRGIGSSAASLVAGTAAALRAVEGDDSPDNVLKLASALEGHDDQVGAAVYGGAILVAADGSPLPIPIHESLRMVVGVPAAKLPTSTARAVIPEVHDHDILLRTLSRSAGLTAGLITGDREMLRSARGDEVHEAHRAVLSPEVEELKSVAFEAGAWHAARSGAGPSVVAISDVETAVTVTEALLAHGVRVINEPIEVAGLA